MVKIAALTNTINSGKYPLLFIEQSTQPCMRGRTSTFQRNIGIILQLKDSPLQHHLAINKSSSITLSQQVLSLSLSPLSSINAARVHSFIQNIIKLDYNENTARKYGWWTRAVKKCAKLPSGAGAVRIYAIFAYNFLLRARATLFFRPQINERGGEWIISRWADWIKRAVGVCDAAAAVCALFATSELLECNSGVFRNECVREVVKMRAPLWVCARARARSNAFLMLRALIYDRANFDESTRAGN
jgi:hypothetical protein